MDRASERVIYFKKKKTEVPIPVCLCQNICFGMFVSKHSKT